MSVALTCRGLRALGAPPVSLDTFAWEFRQGMAALATALGDVRESSPMHWDTPLGSPDVHVVLTAVAPDAVQLEAAVDLARPAYDRLSGVTAVWRQDCVLVEGPEKLFGGDSRSLLWPDCYRLPTTRTALLRISIAELKYEHEARSGA
ncbi:hypothetical protein [Streptomyces sp. NPDC018610]|uniref:hypothetical protein n=1 Tax=Streptomyces sp. NPDC018610 TaxID=3365049 RepID=UPI0037A5BF93